MTLYREGINACGTVRLSRNVEQLDLQEKIFHMIWSLKPQHKIVAFMIIGQVAHCLQLGGQIKDLSIFYPLCTLLNQPLM